MIKKGRPQNQNNKNEFLEIAAVFYDSKRIDEQKKYIESFRKIYNIPTSTRFKNWDDLWQFLYDNYFQNVKSNNWGDKSFQTNPSHTQSHAPLQELLLLLQKKFGKNSDPLLIESFQPDDKIVLSGAFLSAFFDIYRTTEHTKSTERYDLYDKSIFETPIGIQLSVHMQNSETINTTISVTEEDYSKIKNDIKTVLSCISNKKILMQQDLIQSIDIIKVENYSTIISDYDYIKSDIDEYLNGDISSIYDEDWLDDELSDEDEDLGYPPYSCIYSNIYYMDSCIIVENLPSLYDRYTDLIINNKSFTQLGNYIPNIDFKINKRIGTLTCRTPHCILTILQNYNDIQQTCAKKQSNSPNGKRKKTAETLFKVYSTLSRNTLFPEKSIFNLIFAEDITHYNLCRYIYYGFAQGTRFFLSCTQKRESQKDNFVFQRIPLIDDCELEYYFNPKDLSTEAKMYLSAIIYYIKKIALIRHIPTQLIVAHKTMTTLNEEISKIQNNILSKPLKKGKYAEKQTNIQCKILDRLDDKGTGLIVALCDFYKNFTQQKYNQTFIYYDNSRQTLKANLESAYEIDRLLKKQVENFFYQKETIQSDYMYSIIKKNKRSYLYDEKRGIYKDLYNFIVWEVQKCFSSIEEINELTKIIPPNRIMDIYMDKKNE